MVEYPPVEEEFIMDAETFDELDLDGEEEEDLEVNDENNLEFELNATLEPSITIEQ